MADFEATLAAVQGTGSMPSLRRGRLSDAPTFGPWLPAPDSALPGCSLFWLSVSGFPLRMSERSWLLRFLLLLSQALEAERGLRCEQFIRQHAITPALHQSYHLYRQRCRIYAGLGRYIRSEGRLFPSPEWPIAGKAQQPEPEPEPDALGETLLWFANKHPEAQREFFLGCGGFLSLYMKPDATPKLRGTPPLIPASMRASHPTIKKFPVDDLIAGSVARLDSFLEKSKSLFGSDLQERAEARRVEFVLPLLESSSIFQSSAEERARWFELFEVTVVESRRDQGVLLVSKPEYSELIAKVTAEMPPYDAPKRGQTA